MPALVLIIVGLVTLFLTYLFTRHQTKTEQEDLNANENIDRNNAHKQKDSNTITIHSEFLAVRYQKNADGSNKTDGDNENSGQESVHFVRVKSFRLSRLDLEAADSMLLSAKAYSAFVFPGLVMFGILLTCDSISVDSISTCSIIARIFFYIRGISLGIHSALFSPIAFVTYSSDFHAVLTQKLSRKSRATRLLPERFE